MTTIWIAQRQLSYRLSRWTAARITRASSVHDVAEPAAAPLRRHCRTRYNLDPTTAQRTKVPQPDGLRHLPELLCNC